jgi:hypothetical protein
MIRENRIRNSEFGIQNAEPRIKNKKTVKPVFRFLKFSLLSLALVISVNLLYHCGVMAPARGTGTLQSLIIAKDTLRRGDSSWVAVKAADSSPDSVRDYFEIQLTCTWGVLKDSINRQESRSIVLQPDSQGRAGAWLYYPLSEAPGMVSVTASTERDTLRDSLYFAPEIAGFPLTIVLDSISRQELQVAGCGGNEIADITFLVLNQAGLPAGDSIIVTFGKTGSVSDDSLLITRDTTRAGRVRTKLKSGTQAGVAGILASITLEGKTIQSENILIVIHGGLPVDSNFTVTSRPVNIPGLFQAGASAEITVYVFDRYSNPVKPQTPIYFTSNAGGVEAAAYSDEQGQAAVTFWSSELTPPAPGFLASITAKTIALTSYGSDTISQSCQILFSGACSVSISPSGAFDLPNGGSQSFNVHVADIYNHPLCAGSQIKVSASIGTLRGNTDITLDDRISGGTEYRVVLVDADSSAQGECLFKVEVTSPNGNKNVEIWGRIE